MIGSSVENEKTLSDERVLLSETYRQYLERTVRTVSGRYDLGVCFSREIQTNGWLIEVNPVSPLLSPLPNLEQKTLAILGQLAHEYFHIEYTDFAAYRLLTAKYRNTSEFRRQMAYRLFNIIEDSAIERLGCNHYVGLFRRAVYFTNHVAFSQMPAIDEMLRRGAPIMQVLSQATLMFAILDRIKGRWPDKKLGETFEKAKIILEQGKRAENSMGRLRHAENLIALFEPWIDAMEQSGQVDDRSFRYVKNEQMPFVREKETGRLESLEYRWAGDEQGRENRQLSAENIYRGEEKNHISEVELQPVSWDEEVGTLSIRSGDKREENTSTEKGDAQILFSNRLKKWFSFGRNKSKQSKASRNAWDLDTSLDGQAARSEAETFEGKGKEESRSKGGSDHVSPLYQTQQQDAEPLMQETTGERLGWTDPVGDAVKDTLGHIGQAMKEVRIKVLREQKEKHRLEQWENLLELQGNHLATGLHQGIHVSVNRRFPFTEEDEKRYRMLADEVRPLEQVMVRYWLTLLQEENGNRETGLPFGRLDDRRLWHEGTRLFYKRTEQDLSSRLSVLLLVDESGSMKDQERWKHAIRACLLLEGVCRQCHIPFAVIGHMAIYGSNRVFHNHYLNFGSKDLMERKNLVLLGPKENTREGISLRYAGMYLKQARNSGQLGDPDRVKALILSISDGEPEHVAGEFSLKGEAAQEDARMAVKELERQGIGVIGVAIGEKRSAIEKIYHRSLEIQQIEMLPQRLLRQVMAAAGRAI